MHLKKLITENFKALGSREFEFSDGLVIVSGANGSGKTTLLRAVATALFGVQMLPGNREDIPTWGAKGWGLELEFAAGSDSYTVLRTQSKVEVSKNGKLEASGNTPSTKYLEDLIGVTAKDYNLLIHSRQKETGYILNYGTTALQRKVEEFAGVEVLDKVEKLARAEANENQNWLDYTPTPEAPSEERLAELKETLDSLAARNKAYYENLVGFQVQLSQAAPQPEKTVAQLVTKQRAHGEEVQDYKVKQQRIADLEQEVAEFKIAEKPESVGDISSKIAELDEDIELVEKHLRRIEFTKLQLKEFEDLVNPEHNLTEDDLVLLADKITGLEILLGEHRTKVKTLEAERDNGVCNSCGTTLAERPLEEITADIEKAITARTETEEQLTKAKQERAVQNQKIKEGLEYSEKMSRKEQLEKELAELEAEEVGDMAALEEERQKLVEQRAAYRSELARYNDSVAESDNLRLRLENLKNRLGEPPVCEVTDTDIEACEKAWEAFRSGDKLRGAITAEELKIQAIKDRMQAVHDEQQELEKKAVLVAEFEEEKAQKIKTADIATRLSTYLRTKRADYLKQIWDSILYQASTFLSNATNGWLTEIAIEDSKYKFKQSDIWVSVAEASGAQEAFIGVALRVGLNKALYRGQTYIVMDEPTEAMTEENARNLVAAIGGVSEQVVLVTHRETDQALADTVLTV